MQFTKAKVLDENQMAESPAFFGRERELQWFSDQSFNSQFTQAAIVIAGPAGIGKTSLVLKALADRAEHYPSLYGQWSTAIWDLHYKPDNVMADLAMRIEELYQIEHESRPYWIVIDNAEVLTDEEMNTVTSRLLNLKAIKRVLFVTRRRPTISRAEILELEPLGPAEINEMLRRVLSLDVSQDVRSQIASAVGGMPGNLKFFSDIIGRDPNNASNLLKGRYYEFGQGLILPKKELVARIRPHLISVNETLVQRLKREPQSVFELPPRKFEELIAELLSGLGYQVELTSATRDGGKDILAYMSTPHGQLLCLVEAKRYRSDRVIGVELVRQLYGTLIDADASSAMLVTTSSFSSVARTFQQKHQYKLTLKDHGHIVEWIQNHGKS